MTTAQSLRFRNLPALVPGRTDCFMANPHKIVVDPDYNCRDMNSPDTLAHIEWLTESIIANEFTSELHVIRRGEDVVLRRGHCRLAAALKAIERGKQLEGVPVIQMRGNEEVDLLFDQETSNTGLRLDEIARARLVRKARLLGVSDEEIARRMNWKSVSSVKEHIKLLEAPEPLKQDVRNGTMSAAVALQLHKDHGEAAPDVANKIKADVQARGKTRVTPKAVARVTGKKPAHSKENTDRLLDFVAVAGQIQEAVTQAGGIQNIPPEKLAALVQANCAVLAKAKGRHVEQQANSKTESIPEVKETAAQQLDSKPEELKGTCGQPDTGASPVMASDDGRGPFPRPAYSDTPATPTPKQNGVEDLILALKPFADLGNDNDLNAKDDADILEVFVVDVKRAWRVYNAATGGSDG